MRDPYDLEVLRELRFDYCQINTILVAAATLAGSKHAALVYAGERSHVRPILVFGPQPILDIDALIEILRREIKRVAVAQLLQFPLK